MKYKASLDKLAIIMSIAFFLIIGFVFYKVVTQHPRTNTEFVVSGIVLCSLVIMPVIFYLFSPREYEINQDELKIIRPFRSVIIKRDDITDVAMPDERIMKRSIRSFGVGGLFGYYGHYVNKELGGNMTWYATQLRNFVAIRTRGGTGKKNRIIVLTPDNCIEFINALKSGNA